jgi:hypothetical protein
MYFQRWGIFLYIRNKNKKSNAPQFQRITGINQIKGAGKNEDPQADTISIGDNSGENKRKILHNLTILTKKQECIK